MFEHGSIICWWKICIETFFKAYRAPRKISNVVATEVLRGEVWVFHPLDFVLWTRVLRVATLLHKLCGVLRSHKIINEFL